MQNIIDYNLLIIIYRLLMGCNMCNKKKTNKETFDISSNYWIYMVIILIIIISLIYFLVLKK